MAEHESQRGEGPASESLARIIRGATVALVASLVGGGLGFAFSVVMARLLDQSDFGLLVVALNLLIAATALGVAGADYATVRYVASAREPGAKRGAIVTPLLFVFALNVAVSAPTFAFAEPISTHLLGQPAFADPLRALALVLPLTVAAQMFSAGLSGLEHARGELARKCVEQAGRIVFAPIGLALGLGLVGVVLGMAAAALAAACVVGYLLLRRLPRGGTLERIDARKVLSFAWPQTLANVAAQLAPVAVVVVLTHYTSTRTVALFGAAYALGRLPSLVYNSFAFRFSPAIARLWERGERGELDELLKSVTRWVSIVAVPLYAVAIALPAPLLLLYGAEYRGAATALAVIAASGLVNSLTGPVEWSLIMTGRVKLELLANVAAIVPTIAVAFLLISRYELIGAALTTLFYGLVMNGLKMYFVRRTLGLQTFTPTLAGPLAAGAVAASLAVAVEAKTSLGSSAAGAAALGVAVVAVYALVFFRVIGVSPVDRRALALALGRAG